MKYFVSIIFLIFSFVTTASTQLLKWEKEYNSINCGTANECYRNSWGKSYDMEMAYKAKACELGKTSGCVLIGVLHQKKNASLSKRWFDKACAIDSESEQKFNNCVPVIQAKLEEGKIQEASEIFKKICPQDNHWLCGTVEPTKSDNQILIKRKIEMFTKLCESKHLYSCSILKKR